MLRKLLAKYRHFSPGNVWKHLHYMWKNFLNKSLSFKMLVDKFNFLLQLLSKINANFSRFYCNKNLPPLMRSQKKARPSWFANCRVAPPFFSPTTSRQTKTEISTGTPSRQHTGVQTNPSQPTSSASISLSKCSVCSSLARCSLLIWRSSMTWPCRRGTCSPSSDALKKFWTSQGALDSM